MTIKFYLNGDDGLFNATVDTLPDALSVARSHWPTAFAEATSEWFLGPYSKVIPKLASWDIETQWGVLALVADIAEAEIIVDGISPTERQLLSDLGLTAITVV